MAARIYKQHETAIFNATLEDYRIQINSRGFSFKKREITNVPDDVVWAIELYHKAKGLIAIQSGDDLKEKEREALINYLETLNNRIQNYQSDWDEAKRRGSTIEEASAWKRAKRWKEEILAKLNAEKPFEEELSFKNDDDMKSNIFASAPLIEEVKVIQRKKSKSKDTDSFDDINIGDEIGV